MSFYYPFSHGYSMEVVYYILLYSMICVMASSFRLNGRSEHSCGMNSMICTVHYIIACEDTLVSAI